MSLISVASLLAFSASSFAFSAFCLACNASFLAFSASSFAFWISNLALSAISCCSLVAFLASSARAIALVLSLISWLELTLLVSFFRTSVYDGSSTVGALAFFQTPLAHESYFTVFAGQLKLSNLFLMYKSYTSVYIWGKLFLCRHFALHFHLLKYKFDMLSMEELGRL